MQEERRVQNEKQRQRSLDKKARLQAVTDANMLKREEWERKRGENMTKEQFKNEEEQKNRMLQKRSDEFKRMREEHAEQEHQKKEDLRKKNEQIMEQRKKYKMKAEAYLRRQAEEKKPANQ